MAAYDDFLRDHLMKAGARRDNGNANVADGTGGPTYRSKEDELAALLSYLRVAGGVDTVGLPEWLSPPPALTPRVAPSGVIPGANPDATVRAGIPSVTSPQGSAMPNKQAGLDALIADAQSRYTGQVYEDGSRDPSIQMSMGAGRGPMNSIQQAAAVALARMKGMK